MKAVFEIKDGVPRIAEQHPSWSCGIFSFGKAESEQIDYSNTGLVVRPDGDWLVVRRSLNKPNMPYGKNDLVAFLLDDKTPVKGFKIKIPTSHPEEQFEDPRAIYHNGKTYVSACNFVWYGKSWTGAHQVLACVGDDWHTIQRYDVAYGKNGAGLAQNTGHEKNWIWFFHNDRPHLIYFSVPHTVVEFGNGFRIENEYKTETPNLDWQHGEIRGGTPPIRIGDEYWTFFHSSTVWYNEHEKRESRRYHMGAYAFEAKPPFAITKITTMPLLSGSQHDRWAERKPLVVFPCGSTFREGKWFIVGGCNDLMAFWVEIPHAELVALTVDATEKPKTVLSVVKGVVQAALERKPSLSGVTLVCADDRRPDLAYRAIQESCKRVWFEDVKFFTMASGYQHTVRTKPIRSIEDYCRFMVKDLAEHIKTPHCLVVQWDGYVINPKFWKEDYRQYDYIGAPWKADGQIGNGGFSLRSKRLLEALRAEPFTGPFTPEDEYICRHNRKRLEADHGIRFCSPATGLLFSAEDIVYRGQFGFHSFLTRLPEGVARPLVFHHSGDFGDMIYALAAIKAKGGGVLYYSPDLKDGHKTRVRATKQTFAQIEPLLDLQPYLWKAQWTGVLPASVDYDMNQFRNLLMGHPNSGSIFNFHHKITGTQYPEDKPWLVVDFPLTVPHRPVVVSRSLRYRNPDFPWRKIWEKHKDRMLFVGTREEHTDFIDTVGDVPYLATSDMLALARVIYGAKVFIGNQSAPMAIALGLMTNVIQETWPEDANCIFARRTARFDNEGTIPVEWLR